MRLERITLLALLMLAPLHRAHGQEPEWDAGRSIAWQVLHDGEPYSISGIVQTFAAEALVGAAVHLVGTDASALTDSAGRFKLVAPGHGDWELRIRHVGFREARERLAIVGYRRIEVIAVLTPVYAPHCGLTICGRFACEDLEIAVVDAITGKPPPGIATLRVEHESGVRSNSVRLSPDDPDMATVGLGRRVETVGFHTLEVTVPGYTPWRLENVWLELSRECHPILRGGRHEARLVPLTKEGDAR